MKTIRIKYTDWWDGFDSDQYIYNKILSKHYNIVESDDPEYVFCSLYAHDCLKYDGIRIFTTGDNFVPDFNIYDYAIGFNPIIYEDRYLQAPNWIMNPRYENDVERMLHKHENVTEEDYYNRDFCAWVCSNPKGVSLRRDTFEKLSQYKGVASGGRWLNNIGVPDGVSDKIEFQSRYRFSLAIQDSENDGYTDEKLVQCFASRNIPVFWGDKTVDRLFNSDAMVDFYNFDGLDEVAREIERIDNDKDEYLKRLKVPAMRNPRYVEEKYDNLERFLLGIIEQPYSEARRRTKSVWATYYRDILVNHEENTYSCRRESPLKRILSIKP